MEPEPLVDTVVLGRATGTADHGSVRRRPRRAAGGVALLVACALAAAGWAVARGPGSDREVERARPDGPVRNGALVSNNGAAFVPVRTAIPDAYGPDAEESARITSFDVSPTSPVSFSADGTLMLVQDETGWLALRDLWTGDVRRLGACSPRWCGATLSPDGTTVALAGEDSGTGRGIDLMTVSDGTTDHLSIKGMVARTPSWSPDGTRLAFVGEAGIHVVDRDGSGLRLVSSAVPPPMDRPSWSPDGSRLTFARWEPDSEDLDAEMSLGAADFTLVVLDVGSGILDELRDLGTCFCVSIPWPQAIWSPDGSFIAAVTVHNPPRGGVGAARGGGVWLVHPDGSGWRQVSALPPGQRLAWHPLVE